jgi:hypothetical protein
MQASQKTGRERREGKKRREGFVGAKRLLTVPEKKREWNERLAMLDLVRSREMTRATP